MSLDEFLACENEQELRYELVDGQPMMVIGVILFLREVYGEILEL